MKTIQMLILLVSFTFSSVLSASTAPIDAGTNAITVQIEKRLENPNFLIEKETVFDVTFRVNRNNELVVLHVDTENEIIKDYIKKRLNYSKISVSPKNLSKDYVIKIRLTSKQ